MYVYVVFQEADKYYGEGPGAYGRVKARLERASGERCLIVPYQEFNLAVVEELRPRAVVMSGVAGRFQDRKIEGFLGINEVLHKADLPMLCFCGSHQLIGYCFNGDITRLKALRDKPMRKVGRHEHVAHRPASAGSRDLSAYYVLDAFYPVRRLRDDPLFAGLPAVMIMRQSHYCEVKKLPPGFVLLASSRDCRIEAMRHRRRPLYGTQFHPEAYDAPYFHGRRLLRNFAKIVRRFWQDRQR